MAVRCSKDLAGHWLLPHPLSLILVSHPDPSSTTLTCVRCFYALSPTVASVRIPIPMSGRSPSRKPSLDWPELDQSWLLLWHPKAMCYHVKKVGLRAPYVTRTNQNGPIELCNVSFLI